MSDFGNRLKNLRKSLGYSQEVLASKVGSTKRTISYYESESDNPPAKLLVSLAEVLNVSVSVLLGTEEPKYDQRTIDAKFWPKWEKLTSDDKKVITTMTDSLIEKNELLSRAN